ncbi:MAG: MATE family efflux transporter, partial [Blautia sp.]
MCPIHSQPSVWPSALLIGVGSASGFSLSLGAGDKKKAGYFVGNAISMMVILGVVYLGVILIFLDPLLKTFGATEEIMPYAKSYTSITAFGMPLLIITNTMSNLIRADGRPKYSMACMVIGAIVNTILDPIFIFILDLGVAGAAYATVIGQFFSFLMAVLY